VADTAQLNNPILQIKKSGNRTARHVQSVNILWWKYVPSDTYTSNS